jgi:histidyl-tRNA synthetase
VAEKQVYFVQSTGALKEGKTPEMALRFDLTVPLARYVAEHESKLNFPFRRYQIQRVYRGERAQKGRFREFYQCDIDIINREKLSYLAGRSSVIYSRIQEMAIGGAIRINNRKVLKGLLQKFRSGRSASAVLDKDREGGRGEIRGPEHEGSRGAAQLSGLISRARHRPNALS